VQVNCGGPTNINNPIGVPCFYIDTLFTTITVLDCDTTDGCRLYIPNAFTPNSDGRNDGFRTFTSCGLEAYELVVMNRWGERVFITTDPEEQWNGKHKGLACPTGVYAYLVTYTFTNEKKKTKYGLITLIP
jgi:gliding motility-associated-like protein